MLSISAKLSFLPRMSRCCVWREVIEVMRWEKIYSVLLLFVLTTYCGKQANLSGSLGIGEVSGGN